VPPVNLYTSTPTNNGIVGILAPLTAVTDLPSHPTLSRPYTSKTLTDLTQQACDIMHKENIGLWKVKHLHTKLVGDHIWVPCELMESPNDIELYQDQYIANGSRGDASVASLLLLERAGAEGSLNGQTSITEEQPTANHHEASHEKTASGDADTSMADADAPANDTATLDGNVASSDESRPSTNKSKGGNSSDEDKATDNSSKTALSDENEVGGSSRKLEKIPANAGESSRTNGAEMAKDQNRESNSIQILQRALNGSAANLTASGPMSTASLDPSDDMFIHPLFLPPRAAQPNRDLGIPEAEAEDLRRLLQLFVQKQEEVCRGSKRLYEGLLRADRLRKTVFQWSKYEGHVGPNRDMSDGEDWYDKEEWGLEEDLKKGQDEEEEDTMQTTKKTRARR
jgi:hypothetical protein